MASARVSSQKTGAASFNVPRRLWLERRPRVDPHDVCRGCPTSCQTFLVRYSGRSRRRAFHPITNNANVEVLAEAFNLLNRTQVTELNTRLYVAGGTANASTLTSDPSFQTVSAAGNNVIRERQLQFAIRGFLSVKSGSILACPTTPFTTYFKCPYEPRRHFIVWIHTAKRPETRRPTRRLANADVYYFFFRLSCGNAGAVVAST
jgi:hypothetical protein